MITLKNLTYTYPNQAIPALQDISCQIKAGDFILVTGTSGSGKSTLLRTINGLVPHFSGGHIQGEVIVNNIDVLTAGPEVMSQYVGFVFQNPEAQAVLEQVEAEIAFGLENAAVPRPQMEKSVATILQRLNLTHLRHRPITTLSGGERQRVAMATALVRQPNILLLDEPTSQLDATAAATLMDTLISLHEELGLTILLAEHRLERVLSVANRLLHVANGRITIDAPVRQAVTQLPYAPPLITLAKTFAWHPIPLTVAEANAHTSKAVKPQSPPPPQNELPQPSHPNPAPLLSIQALSFSYHTHSYDTHSYDTHPLLQDVNLNLHAGEIVALMGHNGSGKSTLLKCIIGLLQPTSGQITINGRSTTNRSVANICREVAYLPQNPDDLLFAQTVQAELTITLSNHHLTLPEAEITTSLTQLGIHELANSYPRDLSVGQRQRVALGAVTITNPQLLLFDEPTRGLDPQTKQALTQLWQTWCQQGRALLLVTHDVELVAQVADRVILLGDGGVMATGKTAVVLNHTSPFAPQIARLYPDSGWLTIADLLSATPNKSTTSK